jgi:hypothetical protein
MRLERLRASSETESDPSLEWFPSRCSSGDSGKRRFPSGMTNEDGMTNKDGMPKKDGMTDKDGITNKESYKSYI